MRLRQIYLCKAKKKKHKKPNKAKVHPPDRIKEKKKKKPLKRNTILVKTSSFYWNQQSRDVNLTPSTSGGGNFWPGMTRLGLLF
jgi:hypothetical protein